MHEFQIQNFYLNQNNGSQFPTSMFKTEWVFSSGDLVGLRGKS